MAAEEEGGEKENKKNEYLEKEKSFLDEIKSIFPQFSKNFLFVKYRKNSGNNL